MKTLILRAVAGILAVAVIAIAVVYILGGRALRAPISLPPESFAIGAVDTAAVAEGARLAVVYQCTECHGEALGGTDFIRGMPFMNLPAPNLTAGGIGATLTDEQWERAVRHGVGADGRRLLIMPVDGFNGLSNADLAAIVAYARSLPAASTALVERAVGPIGRAAALFDGATLMPAGLISHDVAHPEAVTADGSIERGAYLARACAVCHGADFGGTTLGFADDLLAPDLTPRNPAGVAGWSEPDFVRAMQTGVRPDGRTMSEVMPWRAFGRLSREELTALWRYLRSVPAASAATRLD